MKNKSEAWAVSRNSRTCQPHGKTTKEVITLKNLSTIGTAVSCSPHETYYSKHPSKLGQTTTCQ